MDQATRKLYNVSLQFQEHDIGTFLISSKGKVILQVKAVKTVVVQGQPKTVTVPAPIVLKATTATVTKTRFQLLGQVTSTATETTTTTNTVFALSTSTALASTTTTVTSTATTTSYDACQTDNMVSSVNGKVIVNAYNNGPYQFGGSTYDSISAADAQGCCAAAQSNQASDGTSYQNYAFSSGRCALLKSRTGTCAADQNVGFATLSTAGGGYTFGNGPCGYFMQGMVTRP